MSCRSNECVLAPSKPKEFSLYVHNLQNVKKWDKEGLPSLSRSTTLVSSHIKGATHDLCHLPTMSRKNLLSNAMSSRKKRISWCRGQCVSPSVGIVHSILCLTKSQHSIFSNYIIITARTEGQERDCIKQHPVWYVSRPRFFFPFFFVLLYYFLLIAIFHSLRVKCKHAP